jgi:hypothetical protein
MMVIPTVPVAGMALILGIDRFLSMCRAVVNMTGNAVATLVIARWENELDRDALQRHLQGGTAGNGRSYKAQAGILDNHAYRSQDFIRFREPSPVSRHCAASSESIASMATLTIRQLDQKTKTRLRVRAAHHGRSMEEEARPEPGMRTGSFGSGECKARRVVSHCCGPVVL